MDILGQLLRLSGTLPFKGKGRLLEYWVRSRRPGDIRYRDLSPTVSIRCDLAVPYEAMVWLHQEEELDLSALRKLLRSGDTFVDCGANIGLWTLTAAICVGASGHVHAFEPNPLPRDRLRDTVERSGVTNVTIHSVAAGNRNGQTDLLPGAQHNTSRLVPSGTIDSVKVPVARLDTTLAGSRIDGCKIDVEGHENEVLCGMEELLRVCRPWLCVEFNTILVGARHLRGWKVDSFLRSRGYSPFVASDLLRGRAQSAVPAEREFAGYLNLFYLPEEVRVRFT